MNSQNLNKQHPIAKEKPRRPKQERGVSGEVKFGSDAFPSMVIVRGGSARLVGYAVALHSILCPFFIAYFLWTLIPEIGAQQDQRTGWKSKRRRHLTLHHCHPNCCLNKGLILQISYFSGQREITFTGPLMASLPPNLHRPGPSSRPRKKLQFNYRWDFGQYWSDE